MTSMVTLSLARYDVGIQIKDSPKIGQGENWALSCSFSHILGDTGVDTLDLQIKQNSRVLVSIDVNEWNEASRVIRSSAQRNNDIIQNSQLPFCILYSTINKQIALRRRSSDEKTETYQLTFHSQLDMQQLLIAVDTAGVAMTNMDLMRPRTAPGTSMGRTISQQTSISGPTQSRIGPTAMDESKEAEQAHHSLVSRPGSRTGSHQPSMSTHLSSQRPISHGSFESRATAKSTFSRVMPPPIHARPSTSHGVSPIVIGNNDSATQRPSTSRIETTAYSQESPFFEHLPSISSTPLPPRRIPPHISSSPASTSSSIATRPVSQNTKVTPSILPISSPSPVVNLTEANKKRPLSSSMGNKRPASKRKTTNNNSAKASVAPTIIEICASETSDVSNVLTSSSGQSIPISKQSTDLPGQTDCMYEALHDLKGWKQLPATARMENLDRTFDLRKMLTDDFITFCVDVENHLNRVGLDHARKRYERGT